MSHATPARRDPDVRRSTPPLPARLVAVLAALAGMARLDAAPPVAAAPAGAKPPGVVVCVSPPAADVGAQVLRSGGNAVDAAVATAFALAVTWPEAGNIGGGGFLVWVPPAGDEGKPAVVDFRETAPGRAFKDTFAEHKGPFHGHKTVATPGTVKGLVLAHRNFGRLPWPELVAPAAKLARDGFVLDAATADSLNRVLADLDKAPLYDEFRRVFGKPGGGRWQAGDRLVQTDLADTLDRITTAGAGGFYGGRTVELIIEEMRRGEGLMGFADLYRYEAKLRPPVTVKYRDTTLHFPPPPSSGGIVIGQVLGMLEPMKLRERGRWSADTLHLTAEALRRGFRDRAAHLADPDFVKTPEHLLAPDHIRRLAATINPERATPSAAIAGDIVVKDRPESPQTTHLSVVDPQGGAVSLTTTLEASWGSRIVVKGAGFVLNNEMGDFNLRPGHTDKSGAIGTEPNQIAPRKRMLSSMSPVVGTRDGRVVIVAGSPGGRTIISTVAQVLLNVLEFGMPPQAAVDAPRLHHQWFPDWVSMEPSLRSSHEDAVDGLKKKGHILPVSTRKQGDAHLIVWDEKAGRWVGAADKRIAGAVREGMPGAK